MKSLPIHKYANLFPPMGEVEFNELKESIKQNGQREPVVLFQGSILDGRSRDKACRAIGKNVRSTHFGGNETDALKYVFDINFHRRHLTTSQKAAVVAEYADLVRPSNEEIARRARVGRERNQELIKNGKEKVFAETKTLTVLSDKFSIGFRTAGKARTLFLRDRPLFNKVKEGQFTVEKAFKLYTGKNGSSVVPSKQVKERTAINLRKSSQLVIPSIYISNDAALEFIEAMATKGWIFEYRFKLDGMEKRHVANFFANGFMSNGTAWNHLSHYKTFSEAVVMAGREKLEKATKAIAA